MRRIDQIGYLIAAILLLSGFVHVAILLIGGGSWEGPLSLRKPATFGISFGVTLATIVWVSSWLRLGDRSRTALLALFTAVCVVETFLVSLQAWRGVPSHFNVETPFDAVIGRSMAGAGAALVILIAIMLWASFRANPATPLSLRIAVRFGFATLFTSLIVGGAMIARGMRLVAAGNPQAAYATGGALKPTHAVTMHAVLLLPAFAWLLSYTDWSERRRVTAVLIAAGAYLAVAAFVAAENLGRLG